MGSGLLLVSFFVMLFLNIPIAIALAVSSIVTLLYLDLPLSIIPTNVYASTSKFVLLAIPFFILGGNVMDKAGISSRLIAFFRTVVGHRRNGMGMVTVLVACFFAAISGSGPATVAALGCILIPAMTDVGYDKSYSTALISTAGAIGLIIPPSIAFVVYASITGTSVGALFASGIIPGLFLGGALILCTMFVTRHQNLILLPKASFKEQRAAFKDAFWGMLMPVIILGGIYGGFFTPTEAAAVAAVYGILVGVFVYHSINMKNLWSIMIDTVSQTAVVMLIVGCASLFAYVLTVTGAAADASKALIELSNGNKYIFLAVINVILLIAGCLIDANSAQYILIPILIPVAKALHIDLIYLGCIVVFNLSIGLVTPPVGINLYVGCGIANISLKEICKAVLPLIIVSIIALLVVTYWPPMSLFLPGLLAK